MRAMTATTCACPICRKTVVLTAGEQGGVQVSRWAPFCSERCRLVDLGAWSDGAYAVSRPVQMEDLDQVMAEVDRRND